MSFSMTFRKWLITAVCCIFVLLLLNPACAWAESVLPDEPGDILLIYDNHPGEEVIDNVETLVNVISSMGKIVDYGTVAECQEFLDRYQYIICLNIQKTTEEFDQKLLKAEGKRMVIGSNYLKTYLQKKGQGNLILREEEQIRGTLVYSFAENQEYEEQIVVKGITQIALQNDQYRNGSIHMGAKEYPFCSYVSDVAFLPLTSYEGNLAKASLMQELQKWLWPYRDSPPDYAQYLVIDEVYPFMPADDLMELLKIVIEQQVPYIISVMPILDHGDFPSVKEFCQILSYAQKNNGMIVLHAPIIHKELTNSDGNELNEILTEMTMPYVENGVYPMGIEVPYSWTFKEVFRETLKRYSTVLVYDDGKDTGFSLDDHTNEFLRQGHKLIYPDIQLDHSGVSQLRCYSSAHYLPWSTEKEEILQIVENSRFSSNPFMDLWAFDHSVWLNDLSIRCQDRILYLNGERAELTFEPVEYDTDYDFGRTALRKITIDLQRQNRVLIVLVVVVLFVFAGSIVYARIRTRRYFFKEEKKEQGKE